MRDQETQGSGKKEGGAALAFTEALSNYAAARGGIPRSVLGELRRHCSEPEVAALALLATEEHFYDPVTGALGEDAGGVPAVRWRRTGGDGLGMRSPP